MNARPQYSSGFPPPTQAIPPPEPTPRERIARFQTLARRAALHWKPMLVIVVLGMAGSLALALSVKLAYRSECTILFKAALRTGERTEENPAEKTQRMGAKLKDLLTTRARLEEVIKQFNLYPKTVESRGLVEAADEMRPHIGFRARDSETFVISFESDAPVTAREVTNDLAESMIHEYASTNLSTAQREAEFLAKQEQRSAADFENANKALATFLTLHPEFVVEAKTTAFQQGTGAGAAQPQPGTLPRPAPSGGVSDPQLAVLVRQKARLEAELRNNSGSGALAAPTLALAVAPAGGDSVAKLIIQRDQAAKAAASAAAELAERRTRLTDEHPDVVTAKLTADAAARALHQAELSLDAARRGQAGGNPYEPPATEANVQRKIAQLNADIAARQDAMRRQVAQAGGLDAGAALDPAITETNELVQLETDWQRMLGVLHDVRIEHDDLKQRLERARLSASAAEASGGDQMMVIDPAYKPLTPSKGGRTKTALLGGVVTLLIAIAYAFARVVFSDTIIDSADLEALHVVPLLGVLPKLHASNAPGPPGAPGAPGAGPRGGKESASATDKKRTARVG
jgi:capsular polysaccharide biosynthesis protein